MTKLMEEVISKVRELPAAEQDVIASRILEELAARPDASDDDVQESMTLEQLLQEAREDVRAGRVEEGGFDGL